MSKRKVNTAHVAENALKGLTFYSAFIEDTLSQDFCNRVFSFTVSKSTENINGEQSAPIFSIKLLDTYHDESTTIHLSRAEVVKAIAMLTQIIK